MHDDAAGSASTHGEWLEMAVGYAFDALEPAETEQFLAHLAGCEQCRTTVAEASATMADVAFAVPSVTPPPSLRQSILDAAAATPAPPAAETGDVDVRREPVAPTAPLRDRSRAAAPGGASARRPGRTHRSHGWSWTTAQRLGVAAAVTLLAVIAAGVWTLVARTPQRSIAEQCAQVACPTAQLTDNGRAVARVMVLADKVYVQPVALPPNQPQRNEYVLWRNGPSNTMVVVGGFDVTQQGAGATEVGTLSVPVADVHLLAISKEPGRTPPPKPSTPIASGPLA